MRRDSTIGVQRPVQLPVTGAVESVAHGLPGAGGDGGDAGEGGECGLVAEPAGVGPADEDLRGGDHADAGQVLIGSREDLGERVRAAGGDSDGVLVDDTVKSLSGR